MESFLFLGRISIQGIVCLFVCFFPFPFHPLAATMMETTNEASDKRAMKDKTVNVATARVMRVLLEAEIFAGRAMAASTSIARIVGIGTRAAKDGETGAAGAIVVGVMPG